MGSPLTRMMRLSPAVISGMYCCTITSSLFFEGIPSMSTYGKAFLVLLLLSFGFIGIRRVI